MSEWVEVFVDESGDLSIDTAKSGVTQIFVVTAVVIRAPEVAGSRVLAENVRRAEFQAGEIKSSSMGPRKDNRRIKILRKLNELGLRHYSLVVDKAQLDPDGGLSYRKSFFKFLNRLLYEQITAAYDYVRITADEHGSPEFMRSFRDYFERHFKQGLFKRGVFQFVASDADVLLQVADVYAGSIARYLDPGRQSGHSSEVAELARANALGLVVWPPRTDSIVAESGVEPSGSDYAISAHAMKLAYDYLAIAAPKDGDADHLALARGEVLRYFLENLRHRDPLRFISAAELIANLRDVSGIELSLNELRTGVIAKLRDGGVIIATGPRGYKLPVCSSDLEHYVERVHSVVGPVLERIGLAYRKMMLASHGEIDFLDSDRGRVVKELVKMLEEYLKPEGDADG
jgi:hypothetical protein